MYRFPLIISIICDRYQRHFLNHPAFCNSGWNDYLSPLSKIFSPSKDQGRVKSTDSKVRQILSMAWLCHIQHMEHCTSHLISQRPTIHIKRGIEILGYFLSFIEIYFIYCKIYLLKMYSWVVFTILTELCNHNHILILELFQQSKKKPHTH